MKATTGFRGCQADDRSSVPVNSGHRPYGEGSGVCFVVVVFFLRILNVAIAHSWSSSLFPKTNELLLWEWRLGWAVSNSGRHSELLPFSPFSRG